MEIHTGSIVTAVDRHGVDVKGADGEVTRITAQTKVWAAGVQASPLAKMLADQCGVECDRAGRIPVGPDCTIPGHPEVFAIGDMMSLDGLPGVAEVAMQQGIYASQTIKARLRGHDDGRKPFRYRDLGSMATISRFRAIVSFKGIRVVRLRRLADVALRPPGVHDRVQESLHHGLQWALTFIGKGRSERTLTLQQAVARVAIEEAGGRALPASHHRRGCPGRRGQAAGELLAGDSIDLLGDDQPLSGLDQRQVREGLREVPQVAAGVGVVLLRVEAER